MTLPTIILDAAFFTTILDDAWNGIKQEYGDAWQTNEGKGKIAFEVATAFLSATKIAKLIKLKKLSNKVPTKLKTYTKSNLKLGQQMHKAYKANLHNPAKGLYKEFTGIKGIRPDFVDLNKRIIYELKPNNPRQIKAGWKQLNKYKAEFESQYGGTWETVLDLY